MDGTRRLWLRGAITLGVIGALAAGLMMSPVTAASPFLKKKAYKKSEGIFASFKDGPTDIPSVGASPTAADHQTIASLSVPKGKYAVNAKLYVEASADSSEVSCRLVAGADFDETRIVSNDDAQFTAMALQVVHVFGAAGTIELKCADAAVAPNTDDQARFIKITAVRARSLVNGASA
jgi:hypothetical protein